MRCAALSYAEQVREEIYQSRPSKKAHYRAFCYGLLLLGRRFDPQCVALSTEHLAVSKLYGFAVNDCIGLRAAFTEHKTPRGKSLYSAALTDREDIARLMAYFNHAPDAPNRALMEDECAHMFLSGAFMACGTVSEPSKSYHLEFLSPSDALADLLFERMSTMGYPPKSSVRRGQTVLYFKESEQIEDILTMIGAVKCSLRLMELKIYKDLRNRANRATNCETANIDKLVRASSQQLSDIALLRESKMLERLAAPLREAARLREENPDASLAELSRLSGASRSGVNHRLTRIAQEAKRLRAGKEALGG